MDLRTLNDRVLIRVSPPEKAVGTAGIIVARESREDEHIGQVVACSPNAPVQEGDRVLFQRLPKGMPYDTTIVGDEELLVLREREVLAVVEA